MKKFKKNLKTAALVVLVIILCALYSVAVLDYYESQARKYLLSEEGAKELAK